MMIPHRACRTPPGSAAALPITAAWRMFDVARSLSCMIGCVLTMLALAACAPVPDFGLVQSERAKPVLRNDSFQAASSNGKVLVAATSNGAIVVSADAGKSWTRHHLEGRTSVIALAACPDGVFVGIDFYRKLWVGDAAGHNWTSQPLDKQVEPMAVTCDSRGRVWVAGSHTTLLTSADLGHSWKKQDFDEDAIFTTVQFVDDQHGIVTGEFGTVLTTEDAGATWHKRASIPGDFYPYSTVFADAQRGWSSGLGGVIQHTADGGKSWTSQDNRSGAPMYSLLRQGEDLYGVGAGGQMVVLRGSIWERFDHGLIVPAYLTSGAVLDARSMLVAGAAGALHMVVAPAHVALVARTSGAQP